MEDIKIEKPKTIVERLMDRFCLEGKITGGHADDIKATLEAELERIAERVIGDKCPHNNWCDSITQPGAEAMPCDCGVAQYNQKRQEIITILKDEGIIK